MLRVSKFTVAASLLAGGLVLTGCASNGGGNTAQAATASTQAVTCSKCQTTWVKIPNREKGRIVSYSTRKQMVCPDCKDAVASFFDSGKFQHTCKTCGDSMELCEGH
jgi:hypothetical protein